VSLKLSIPFDCSFCFRRAVVLAQSQNATLRLGICLPKSCSSVKDVEAVAKLVLSRVNLEMTSVSCKSNPSIPFRIRMIAIVIFSVLLLNVVGCTIYELYMRRKGGEWEQTHVSA
jgi:hypothetical protein